MTETNVDPDSSSTDMMRIHCPSPTLVSHSDLLFDRVMIVGFLVCDEVRLPRLA
jgi:hypothetical protein